MSARLNAFRSYKSHAWLKKAYAKLKAPEVAVAEAFIAKNDSLPKGAFELAINRMFIDVSEKPKNYTVILELLTCANSSIEA